MSVIQRWHFREGIPIQNITKRSGLSRNTIRKYLASGVVEPCYPKRNSPYNLDDYKHTLLSSLSRDNMLHMMFKLGQRAENKWRRLRGFDYLAKIVPGIKFTDGIEVTKVDQADA